MPRNRRELEDAYWKDEDKHVMRKQRKVGARAKAAGRTWSAAGSETGAEARAVQGPGGGRVWVR